MDAVAFHLEVRNTIVLADELSRWAHAYADHPLAGGLGALRSSLEQLERSVGRSHTAPIVTAEADHVTAVERALEALLVRRDKVPGILRRRFETLVAAGERVSLALWEPTTHLPSKPVLGGLPLVRAVPQDVRTAFDVGAGVALLATAVTARTASGKLVGAALGAVGAGATFKGDTRLGITKTMPVESLERVQIACGLAAICAPFVLGYARKDPITAAVHVATGVVGVALALVTDWRAARGVTRPVTRGGAVTGFVAGEEATEARPRIHVGRKPLEGLSSAGTTWPDPTDLDPPS